LKYLNNSIQIHFAQYVNVK